MTALVRCSLLDLLEMLFQTSAPIEDTRNQDGLRRYPKGDGHSAPEAGRAKSSQQIVATGSLKRSGGETVAFRDDGFHVRLCTGWGTCVLNVTLDAEDVRFCSFRVDD